MCININKSYEKNYKSLNQKQRNMVDDALYFAMVDNHINICSECATKYFALPKNIDFTQTCIAISEDYMIDNNVCGESICEFADCQNEADYTVNLIEEDLQDRIKISKKIS